jgi:hypothetical protein
MAPILCHEPDCGGTLPEAFYRSQFRWLDVYTGEPGDEHREKVAQIERLAGAKWLRPN